MEKNLSFSITELEQFVAGVIAEYTACLQVGIKPDEVLARTTAWMIVREKAKTLKPDNLPIIL